MADTSDAVCVTDSVSAYLRISVSAERVPEASTVGQSRGKKSDIPQPSAYAFVKARADSTALHHIEFAAEHAVEAAAAPAAHGVANQR